jgi:hypothetical protein
MKPLKLYLFLASRSKQGIKLVTVLQGDRPVNSGVTDLTAFALPQIWERRIFQILHENRMLYEARIESAGSFEELKASLKARGFTNLPTGPTVMLDMGTFVRAPKADTSSCQVQKTMLRKRG